MILKKEGKLVSVFQPGNNPTTQQREQSQFQLQAHGFLPSLQYSMDEKNDKQGGAFSRESEIYQRSGQKKTSWRVPIHNRGCSLANVLALDMSWLKQMSE